ncbi:STAS-like domain-containing protein [Pseudomonas kulmbachensis]|uniref:STAS-like domain-containing protein n=1 Tax=Pseudomonas kulmbachensis TaxID=3043408 RepID=UPI002AB202D0|nr:STAS-like domain-containing protein [Pseudomonas sp. V3/3/4/13]
MILINVKDFSEFPGPRREVVGPNSGEKFRETVLLPTINSNPDALIVINLDGTAGYGSSFLEESFGGLIRHGIPLKRVQEICDNIISLEDDSLIEEIRDYVAEAQEQLALDNKERALEK